MGNGVWLAQMVTAMPSIAADGGGCCQPASAAFSSGTLRVSQIPGMGRARPAGDPDRTIANQAEEHKMYARTTSWTGTPEALEKWAKDTVETVAPMVAGLPGNAGAYFFIDRAGGRGLTLTLWETEDAELASHATAEKSRARTVAATGVEPLDRGRYEVTAKSRRTPDKSQANKDEAQANKDEAQ